MLQVLQLSPIISQDITSVSGTRMCWTGMPRRLQWLMPRTQSRLIVRWRMLNSDLLICAPMLVNWLFSSRYVIICFGLRLIIAPQLLPDVPEPSSYWSHDDPRALAAHKGIIAEMYILCRVFNMWGESFDNIQCVQKSPQFGPFPKEHKFLRRRSSLIGWIILLWHGHWSYFKHSLWYGHSSWHEHSS